MAMLSHVHTKTPLFRGVSSGALERYRDRTIELENAFTGYLKVLDIYLKKQEVETNPIRKPNVPHWKYNLRNQKFDDLGNAD